MSDAAKQWLQRFAMWEFVSGGVRVWSDGGDVAFMTTDEVEKYARQ